MVARRPFTEELFQGLRLGSGQRVGFIGWLGDSFLRLYGVAIRGKLHRWTNDREREHISFANCLRLLVVRDFGIANRTSLRSSSGIGNFDHSRQVYDQIVRGLSGCERPTQLPTHECTFGTWFEVLHEIFAL